MVLTRAKRKDPKTPVNEVDSKFSFTSNVDLPNDGVNIENGPSYEISNVGDSVNGRVVLPEILNGNGEANSSMIPENTPAPKSDEHSPLIACTTTSIEQISPIKRLRDVLSTKIGSARTLTTHVGKEVASPVYEQQLDISMHSKNKNEDVNISPAVEVKRGRGRPKRSQSNEVSKAGPSDVLEAQTLEPMEVKRRGRGRPKNSQSSALSMPISSRAIEITLDNNCSSNTSVKPDSYIDIHLGSESMLHGAQVSISPTVEVKRGRGRPKRSQSDIQNTPTNTKAIKNTFVKTSRARRTSKVSKAVIEASNDIDDSFSAGNNNFISLTTPGVDTPMMQPGELTEEKLNEFKERFQREKKLMCELCGKMYRSFLGWKYHAVLCGRREEAKVTCEICQKSLMPSSMTYHMANHSVIETAEEEEPMMVENDAETNGIGKRKRRSAVKAANYIKRNVSAISGTENESDDPDDDCGDEFVMSKENPLQKSDNETSSSSEDDDLSGDDVSLVEKDPSEKKSNDRKLSNDRNKQRKEIISLWTDFINVPGELRDMPKGFTSKYNDQLKKKKIIHCPWKGCEYSFKTVPGLVYHYRRCGLSQKYGCKICEFECSDNSNRGLLFHMYSDHIDNIPRLPDKLQSLLFRSPTEKRTNKKLKTESSSLNSQPPVDKKYILDYNQTLAKPNLYTNLMPKKNNWKLMQDKECQMFLPQTKASCKLKFSPDEVWRSLNIFDSTKNVDHITFFVGGPVWSVAWCPQPDNITAQPQFAAIATCINFQDDHRYSDEEAETGLIQVWEFDDVTDKPQKTEATFGYGICHSYGAVWDMVWCPLGNTWQSPDGRPVKEQYCRLGLMAIACGDGEVRILSLPWPDDLRGSVSRKPRFYKAEPVMLLDPPGLGPAVAFESTICKSVAWSAVEPNLIAGGYGSGIVALWDISNKSSFLIVCQPSPDLDVYALRPLTSWIAHSAAVNSIKFCPWKTEDRFILTAGSIDRNVKLWDLDDLIAPVKLFNKAGVNEIAWSYRWPGVFSGFDDGYTSQSTPSYYRDLIDGDEKLSLSCHRSAVWSIDYSDWVNAEASVDSSGEATVMFNFYYGFNNKGKDKHRLHKCPLYRMSIKNLDERNETSSIDYQYENMIASKGILFHDSPLSEFKKIAEADVKRIKNPESMQYENPSNYPLVSIQQVRWNPNFQARNWLLSGGQAGICRISCMQLINKLK